ncbi:helix-turn-helix domain-containing protein, partial [Allomesorhizobium camelthorni]
ELGTSPQAVYTQIRLDHARHLLLRTDRSISSIALECGFCDGSHLSRVFRLQYLRTPQEFRSQHGESLSLHRGPRHRNSQEPASGSGNQFGCK